jgi:hypothetical protein
MILSSSFVELLVVDTHPPTSDRPLRNECIFLIVDNSHFTILQRHLYWTDPFIIRDGVDNSSLMILLHGNAMSAKTQANSLQILERIANY